MRQRIGLIFDEFGEPWTLLYDQTTIYLADYDTGRLQDELAGSFAGSVPARIYVFRGRLCWSPASPEPQTLR